MSNNAVIGFYGESKSGKTTLIVKIIEQLTKDGLNVATIKKTDKNIEIDTKGKDTWKHHQAGASFVVLSSANNVDIMINKRMETKKIVDIISEYESFDIILVEGANDPRLPKIKIGNGKERDNTIMQYQNDAEKVVEIIKKEIDKKKRKQKIKIEVNGKEIALSEFPADIITGTLVGMLSSLKGINQINEVKIRFKNELKK